MSKIKSDKEEYNDNLYLSAESESNSNLWLWGLRDFAILCVAMLVFLAINGYELNYTQNELSDLILDVASDKKEYEDILYWLLEHQA